MMALIIDYKLYWYWIFKIIIGWIIIWNIIEGKETLHYIKP